MRFVPTFCLREGMTNAKNLYDKNGQLLLKWGEALKINYIDKIKQLGYQGLYIDDDLSQEIVINDVISDELKNKAVRTIKDVFVVASTKSNNMDIDSKIFSANKIVEEIIDEISSSDLSIVNMIDLKFYDEYTYYHSVNVCVLSIVIGLALGFNNTELMKIGLGSILHDIGKLFINKNVLNKKGKLTDEEYELIKNHSQLGYDYLKRSYSILPTVASCVLYHHERYDGTGYPKKVSGDNIPIYGRIVTICDVYDALISNRPYRKALLPSEAMEYIMANGGTVFDPKLVEIFVRKIAPFPVGTLVKLSNGFTAIIINNYEECCMRPLVKIIADEDGNKINQKYLDLRDNLSLANITITGIVES